jgi:predicted ATPase with chaperone activity
VGHDRQLPSFTVVWLPDSAVRVSRERVMAAVRNAGPVAPPARHSNSTSPPPTCARRAPPSTSPIAIGILVASEQLSTPSRRDFVLLGELSLDASSLRPVRDVSDQLQSEAVARWISPRCGSDVSRPHR